MTGTPKLASYDDVAALDREVVERGYRAFKTNIVVPGEEPAGSWRLVSARRTAGGEISDALVRLLEAFAEGTGGAARPIVDLNFNLEPEGILGVAKRLEPFDLLWLEVDLFDPAALEAGRRAPMPVCSGENLCRLACNRPFLEAAAFDVASVDVIERVPPGEEDRRPGRDIRGQLRPAQLLQPPRDVHRRAVVRRDSERADPRVRRRRRAVA